MSEAPSVALPARAGAPGKRSPPGRGRGAFHSQTSGQPKPAVDAARATTPRIARRLQARLTWMGDPVTSPVDPLAHTLTRLLRYRMETGNCNRRGPSTAGRTQSGRPSAAPAVRGPTDRRERRNGRGGRTDTPYPRTSRVPPQEPRHGVSRGHLSLSVPGTLSHRLGNPLSG